MAEILELLLLGCVLAAAPIELTQQPIHLIAQPRALLLSALAAHLLLLHSRPDPPLPRTRQLPLEVIERGHRLFRVGAQSGACTIKLPAELCVLGLHTRDAIIRIRRVRH
eukprot:4684618-Prymnesium_polylepis.1